MNSKYKTVKNLMPSSLIKVLIFILILFVLDFSIGSILRYYYFKQDSGLLYRTTYSLEGTEAEIIIFGSSYANHHYKPKSFEERLEMSVYNAGRDNNYIFYHYAILKGLLKRYTPKKIILDFNFAGFKNDDLGYETMSSLLPYYKNHPEIRSIIQMRGHFEKYKQVSQIYPFNSLIFTIGIGNLEYNKTTRNKIDEDGYVPLKNKWNKPISTDTLPPQYELDSNRIIVYKRFIEDCIKHNTELYIVVSPRYVKYTYKDPSILIAKKIADDFEIPFYNFLNLPEILTNPQFFVDETHLNDSGAMVFSNKVIDNILQDSKTYHSHSYINFKDKKK